MITPVAPTPPEAHVYRAEIDLERERWTRIIAICRAMTEEQRLRPGYYDDPEWSVRDLVGHLGAWLAEAKVQLEQIAVGTHEDVEVDVDALNATFLRDLQGQPWPVIWIQANAARNLMLSAWFALDVRSDPADWWVRKCGADHYAEHLPRLEKWWAILDSNQ